MFVFGTALALAKPEAPVAALENGLARTPPMGWNSWNKFACNINESLIRQTADAMVGSGMRDAGYLYVNIDDCWMAPARDANGNLVADPTDFPSGIKALADYVHARGLKLGIYEDRGTLTCQKLPGSYGHETQDAATFAAWGVDYLKYDNCNAAPGSNQQQDYERMRDALAATGRPIVYSICQWGQNSVWTWGAKTGNLWRTTGDISANWDRIMLILDRNAPLAQYAGPGGWNDPDMLEVGNGSLTAAEYRSHFSLWAVMAAPLIAGNDLRSMSQSVKDILLNTEVITVDQDPLGVQGSRVRDTGDLEVWSKPLQGGARAVVLFNRGAASANMTVNWTEIGLPAGPATVRDLWAKADRGTFNNSFTANVASHGVVMIKVVSSVPVTSYEAEAAGNTLSGAARVAGCTACSSGAKVGFIGNGSTNFVTVNNINAGSAGSYPLTIHGLVSGTRSFFVSVNGGAGIEVPMSGSSWDTPTSTTVAVQLNAGTNSIKFYNNSAYAPDLDRIVLNTPPVTPTATRTPTLTPTATPTLTGTPPSSGDGDPYGGTPWVLPGTIQAEDFNTGGQGAAYNDTDVTNNGGQYRMSEAVDIQTTTDTGGSFNVGWTRAGEWLKYTVNAQYSGTYMFNARAAANGDGARFHVEVDGAAATGPISVPNTGGWQTWTTVGGSAFYLSAGPHVLRVVFDTPVTGGTSIGNYNFFSLSLLCPTPTPEPLFVDPVISPTDQLSQTIKVYTGNAESVSVSAESGTFTVNAPSTNPVLVDITLLPNTTHHLTVSVKIKTTSHNGCTYGGYTLSTTRDRLGNPLTIVQQSSVTPTPTPTATATQPSNDGQPYGGTPWALPGTIQAEDFNTGGQGVAYNDVDVANNGAQYRPAEAVDIQTTTDTGGGFNVGWTRTGEWVKYTVNVTAGGAYTFNVRVAAAAAGAVFHLEVDGVDVTGPISVPNTGSNQVWTTISRSGLNLTAGQHVLRVVFDTPVTGGASIGNYNYFTFTAGAASAGGVREAPAGSLMRGTPKVRFQ